MSSPKQKFDPLKNYWSVSLMEAEPLIKDVLKAGWVPNLVSSPGLGKSALIRQIAEELGLLLIDVRLSQMAPEDLNGFPTIIEKEITLDDGTIVMQKKASYIPMDTFPVAADPITGTPGDTLPINPATGVPYKGWLLFLDEFNSATPSVQVAAYKIVLDKMIGNHKLHPKCLVATAGNLMTDKAIVNRSSTATQSRIIHFAIRVDHDAWHWWAIKTNVDHRVMSFMKRFPEALHDFDPNHTDLTFPCPRTWEMVSDCIKPMKEIKMVKRPLLAGCVGTGRAREFYAYTEVFKNLPDIERIIQDPENVGFDPEPSVHYALAGLIGAKMTEKTAEPCIKFLSRLGADFQVTALRQAIAREPAVFQCKAVKDWLRFNTKELINRRA